MSEQVYSSNKQFSREQQQNNSQEEDGLSEDGFSIQQSGQVYILDRKSHSKRQLIIGIISFFIITLISYYLFKLWRASEESDSILKEAVLEHELNLALQNHWQNSIEKARKDIKQIKQKKRQASKVEDKQISQLKGIVYNYENVISAIQTESLKIEEKLFDDEVLASQTLADMIRARKTVAKLIEANDIGERQNEYGQKTLQEGYKFIIPKNIWVFKENAYNYLRKLSYQNLQYYAKASGYRVHFVNYESLGLFLPPIVEAEVKIRTQIVSRRLSGQFIHLTAKKIILLNFLKNHGGMMVFNQLAFTQNLNWIEDIASNQFVIRGNRLIEPQVIAFYNPLKSNPKKKYNNLRPFIGMEQVDKYVHQIPAIEQYFIASKENTRFLSALIKKIYALIDDIDNFKHYTTRYELAIESMGDFIRRLIFVASTIILREHQITIDNNKHDGYKHFAIDYFGMNFINAYYGPLKMELIYQENVYVPNRDVQLFHHKLYYDLARYSYEELVAYTGHFKYLCKFAFEYDMNNYLERSSKGKNIVIYKGSFIQRIFYPDSKQLYMIESPQKHFTSDSTPTWTEFTEIIWVFFDQKEIIQSQFSKLCIHHLKKMAQNSTFQIRYVSHGNIYLYLQQTQIEMINNIVRRSKIDSDPRNAMHFYRLSILYLYGGIFVDSNSFTLQNYDWVMNIARIPSRFIFHRFGLLPKVVMMFLPYVGSSQKWTYDPINKIRNTKIEDYQQLDSHILIAERDSEFIGDWLNSLFTIHKLSYYQLERLFIQNRVGNLRSSSYSFPDEVAMFTARYTLKRKQISLYKRDNRMNVINHYKIWTINGDLTPSKLKSKFNYEGEMGPVNSFFYRFPRKYVEQVVGQIRFFASFILDKAPQVNQFLLENAKNNFTTQFHSKSILMEMILGSSYLQRNIDKRDRPNKNQIFQ